jgi:hypothetical protein
VARASDRLIHDYINITTSGAAYTKIKEYDFDEGLAIRFELKLVCKELDGTSRGAFKRIALLYRNIGDVLRIENGTWNTDQSLKSHDPIDVAYNLVSPGRIEILVRNADIGATNWVGNLYLMVAR